MPPSPHPDNDVEIGSGPGSLAVPGTRHDKEMPPHWQNNFRWPPFRLAFKILCLISVGNSSLERKWKGIIGGEEEHTKHTSIISQRITQITFMAGLLLPTTAALVTTGAPKPKIIDYTVRGPYLCIWASFGILLGGAIVGSADIFVMATCTAKWTTEVLMSTRTRVVCVLILLAYPFLSIGAATITCAFGLLAAAWISADDVVKKGCGFLLIVPASLILLFVASTVPPNISVAVVLCYLKTAARSLVLYDWRAQFRRAWERGGRCLLHVKAQLRPRWTRRYQHIPV